MPPARRSTPEGAPGPTNGEDRGGPVERDIAGWFARQLPEDWFTGPPRVLADRDEILVLGSLAVARPETGDAAVTRERAAIVEFRGRTRDERMGIAARAEALFGRKVSWGAGCGGTEVLFTHLSIPVMTRLRIDERRILDTLVAGGVARSRSDALAWCVRLVGEHEAEWIAELRQALEEVERVRTRKSGRRV